MKFFIIFIRLTIYFKIKMGNECSCYGSDERIKDSKTISMHRPLNRQSYVAGHKSMTK